MASPYSKTGQAARAPDKVGNVTTEQSVMSDGKTPCRKCSEKEKAKEKKKCCCREEIINICTGPGCYALGYLAQSYPERVNQLFSKK